jgi:hypothetical protein
MTNASPTWTAASLFERWFLPLYPAELRSDLARARLTDVNPAGNPRLVAAIEEIAEAFAKLAPAALGADLDLDFSDASVHRLAAALTREARDRLLGPVTEPGAVPDLVHLVTHGVAYIGACVVKNHGGTWQLRAPLWESLVRLESRAGTGDLALFQWWLKALSDEEIGEPRLGDRYRMNVEVPTARPEELPVIAPPDRKLPRLTKVRYDALYRHLKAHIPELRDVGEHFPSAERFAELAFEWLDFMLLGGGRMLLLHGPTANGVHLLWLDAAGFVGSAFFPADAVPAHHVALDGDKLVVTVPVLGREARHEMLWWGPASDSRR